MESLTKKDAESPTERIRELEAEVARLLDVQRSVADANAMAAELMVKLEETADDLNHANEELTAEHAQKVALHSAIRSALIVLDDDTHVTEWNEPAEQMFELAADKIIGCDFTGDAFAWPDQSVNDALNSCRQSGIPSKVDDIRFRKPCGATSRLALTITRLKDGDDVPMGFLILGDDVTEEKELHADLAQSQKMQSIGQLAAGIAHEINTPVQYVGDNLNFIQESFEDVKRIIACVETELENKEIPEKSRNHILSVLQEADWTFLLEEFPVAAVQALDGVHRVATIVRAMKEFSHPAADTKVASDLNRLIETTSIVASSQWKHVAELEMELGPGIGNIPCFPDQFNQVILNMIVNAAHAITDAAGNGAKGVIRIQTGKDDSFATIRISDNGSGMPEDVRERVFEPFYTTKEVGKGTGQGLSVAHDVVVCKHGGSISVESELGTGTTFIISLPIGNDTTVTE